MTSRQTRTNGGTEVERRTGFERWVTSLFERRRSRGFVTGLVAGGIAAVVMSCFRTPISQSPPPTAWFWAKYVGDGDPHEHVAPGLILHLLYGVAGGGAFGAIVAARESDSDSESESERRGTLLGLVYGLLLSGFGVSVVLKRVLGLDLEPDERFVFHVSHVVYGLTLGTWFGANAP
ncbi:hypothetical protein ACFQPA_18185 [Halomarina halobia]|uniref:DUF1440 domain-containing protein n=1 Tax=Halomarina halobia TaxID=3033386 RepID=A0ABD6ADP2_9EURY|nr:hypothetical protein [Halomarina sp. PSR21]